MTDVSAVERWTRYLAGSWGEAPSLDSEIACLGDQEAEFVDLLRRTLALPKTAVKELRSTKTFREIARAGAVLWRRDQVLEQWRRQLAEFFEYASGHIGGPVGAVVFETPFPAEWEYAKWTIALSVHTYDGVGDFRKKLNDPILLYSTEPMLKDEIYTRGLLLDERDFGDVIKSFPALIDECGLARKDKLFAAIGVHDGGFDHMLEL